MTPPIRHRGVFVIFDPEAAKLALDEVCQEAGVEVLLHAFVSGADRDGSALSKDRSVIARLPLSGDVVAYLASEHYDARDARIISRAEMAGRAQARTYLEIRELPGWERAYLASTGPEFGTRESRHINSSPGTM